MDLSMADVDTAGGGRPWSDRKGYSLLIHSQWVCVVKMGALIGDHAVSEMLQLDQEAITQHFANFAVYEQGLLRYLTRDIPTPVSSLHPQVVVTPSVRTEQAVKIKVKSFHGNDRYYLVFW
ncbi:hypothetical protein Plhal304r1_c010g0040981 [Plasmopara halstedii]